MDKLACHVVKDLLPLYSDRLISDETTTQVEEHLAGCQDCQQALEDLQAPPVTDPEPTPGSQKDEVGDRVARGVKRTLFALAALFLLVGMFLAGGVLILFVFLAITPPLYTWSIVNFLFLAALVLGLLGAMIWMINRVRRP